MTLPIVAIVGRPNVGKSSLFNRLIQKRLAVVDAVSGVTRDRNFSRCEWNGRTFYLVDTGGMVPGTEDQMERLILEQAAIAVEDADLIIFVVDCQTGVTALDDRIVKEIIRTNKPIILAVNNSDNDRFDLESSAFYSLGIEPLLPISAINGRGTGDLLDEITARLPKVEDEAGEEGLIRVAVVGRPNVGKSSFVNQLLGENRHIVSDMPGTTRDAIDSEIAIGERRYLLIDTAGLRKRSKITENLEYYTSLRTLRAIERCDIAVVLLDANAGLNFQELKIIDEVGETGRGMVLAVNKWDIFDKDPHSVDIYTRQIREAAPTYDYIPIIFVSALTGQRIVKTMSQVDAVYAEYTRRIPTPDLNDFLQNALRKQPPAAVHGKWVKLFYMTQAETAPPVFIIFTNHPDVIQESYKRYLANQLREQFGFAGAPLIIRFKGRRVRTGRPE